MELARLFAKLGFIAFGGPAAALVYRVNAAYVVLSGALFGYLLSQLPY